METTLQDLRYACRQLLRARGFFAIAVATLALGVGVNTSLFSLLNAAFLTPPPGVRDASSLVWIASVHARTQRIGRISQAEFDAYRGASDAFSDAALLLDQSFTIRSAGEPEQVPGQIVSANYLDLLRTPLAIGRGFRGGAGSDAEFSSVVISHEVWQRHFGGDPSAVGATLFVNRVPCTIVGVAPPSFGGAEREGPKSVWVPSGLMTRLFPAWTALEQRDARLFKVVARLRPGVTVERATGDVAAIAARSENAADWTAAVFPAAHGVPPRGVQQVLPLVAVALAVTGLILLIACANVGNLMLARGLRRRAEIGVRLALGASRPRLLRQLLTESLLLAAVASACGLLFALWTLDLLRALVPDLPVVPAVDWRVLLFSAATAGLVAAATGLLPALVATRMSFAAALRVAGCGQDVHQSRLQSAFLVAQVSVSLVLLTMAGLFVRSLERAHGVDVGFQSPRSVIAATIHQPVGGERPGASTAERILERASALPGVRRASLTLTMPMAEWVRIGVMADPEGVGQSRTRLAASQFIVYPGFFEAIGLPLLRGRDFDQRDTRAGLDSVIVNEALSRRLWGEGDPLGRTVRLDTNDTPATVVGLVRNSAVADLEDPQQPAIYLPYRQSGALAHVGLSRVTILVRTESDASSIAAPLRREIAAVDDQIAISRIQTLDRFREDAVAGRRVGAGLLAVFGALGLTLAAVGIAGGTALSVGQRTREIGLRVALGASPSRVVRHFMLRGMRLTSIGVAIGLSAALLASRALSSMLFGIGPSDFVAYLGVTVILACVAGVACWVPARRAAGVDPVKALASE